ncbi:hypothetical protein L6164_002375 [Bauhinia variegata]|uniref:Uncharacterized protein n=1 Tax=Bauhinia variegata TaxID=167791 RepID=A0ACB9PY19_BAUVA|nr:hypothetical protein L6164_002375 [Bauhinia variegata]
MDRIPRLLDAARRGDVAALQQLLNEDPQILNRVTSSTIYTETPLHVAALAGQTDFGRGLITLMPSLALEKNHEGVIPLHIASARGHLEMVRELLTLGSSSEQCLLKGQDGRIPLHDAIIKGRVPVIQLLISHCAESLEELTERGETVFHLASKNNQFEALEVVAEKTRQRENFRILFNAKDKEGNTFWRPDKNRENNSNEFVKKGQLENAMLVVAALIVTVTYQGCLSPPPTIWKAEKKHELRNLTCVFKDTSVNVHNAPDACPAASFYVFMALNTTAFLSAVFLIAMLSLKRELILLLASIFPLLCSYMLLLETLCPDYLSAFILVLSSFGLLAVGGFTVLIAKFLAKILMARLTS